MGKIPEAKVMGTIRSEVTAEMKVIRRVRGDGWMYAVVKFKRAESTEPPTRPVWHQLRSATSSDCDRAGG